MKLFSRHSDDLRVDVSEGVGTIVLNRPERLNALSTPMIEAFASAVSSLEARREVGALIVTGPGVRSARAAT